jgi:photosystem II stability/assembly factor-like uncharacterized protein
MKKSVLVLILAAAAVAAAAGAARLPGDVLVASPKAVEAVPGEGVWFLANSPAGYLYLARLNALPRLAPYRVLHREPETARYYLLFEQAPGEAARAAALGTVTPLGGRCYLFAAERGRPDDLAALALRAELVRLGPTPFPSRRAAPEEPAPAYDAEVAAAMAGITEDEVREYLTALQDVGTRYSSTPGYRDAAEYCHDLFAELGYETAYDTFFGDTFYGVALVSGGAEGWAVTEGGSIYHTTDSGDSWESQEAPASGFLWSVDFVDANHGWSAGEGGTLLATADGGATWTRQNFPYSGIAFGVDFTDASRGWVVADAGRIFRTTNGGSSWTELSSPTGSRLYDVAMADASHGWACGRDGVILHTDDGASWVRQTTPTNTRLYGVAAVSAAEGWACGWNNTLLHTTDGGATWTFVNYGGINEDFYGISFPDASHGYVAGTGGVFLKTSDGGANWTHTFVGDDDFQCCTFATANFGMFGGTAAFYRTADGGATFASLADNFGAAWSNVVAEKAGWGREEEVVIVCGHLDDTSETPLALAPGADDNGTGSCAAMAAAGALAELWFERTLRFIVWCGEEQGLLGSRDYAGRARAAGENIVGVVNLDMVAYDEENGARDDTTDVANDASRWLAEYWADVGALYDVAHSYDLLLGPFETGSDHSSFWNQGYDAILLIEGEAGPGGISENPYYHTTGDTVDTLSMKLMADNARVATATAAHLAHHIVLPYAVNPAPPRVPFRVYPNPFRAGGAAAAVRFDGVPAGARLRVYDVAGGLVFEAVAGAAGYYDWPVVTAGGAAAASGVYLYRVEGAGLDETGKLAVLR